jgi:hypothetical protein
MRLLAHASGKSLLLSRCSGIAYGFSASALSSCILVHRMRLRLNAILRPRSKSRPKLACSARAFPPLLASIWRPQAESFGLQHHRRRRLHTPWRFATTIMASPAASTWLTGRHGFVGPENAALDGQRRILLYHVRGTGTSARYRTSPFILWPFIVRKDSI